MTVAASKIGLPTTGATVTSATVVAASGTGATAVGSYCLVMGAIAPVDSTAPNITFNLALPARWNQKIMMFGGGGTNGTVPAVTGTSPQADATTGSPLGRGYAVFASDSGHQARLSAKSKTTALIGSKAVVQ
jgi:feruloyl esterase